MSTIHFKDTLNQFCKNYIEERIARIQKNIQDVQIALSSETKNSAGDKHETGRAMLQLEREKLGQQLAEAEKTKQVLLKVPSKLDTSVISLGSLVKTSKANYYLAISAGEYKSDGQIIFCISAGTPIGQLLMGKTIGNSVVFNGNTIEVLEII